MLSRIILSLIISSAVLLAQNSSIHGNLLRIPFDAAQINPADTMGSWSNISDSNGYSNSEYINIINIPQSRMFEKQNTIDYSLFGLTTQLYLENFTADTSSSCGVWLGYYDVPEPYIIYRTIPRRVENGTWMMNGVYNMSFVSDAGEITVLPQDSKLYYICGKINDKYLTSFKREIIEPAYDLYLLDLSGSPDFDTTNAEKIFIDFPAAPYDIYQVSNSLYIAGVDSLPYNGYGVYLFNLAGDTLHSIKKVPGYIDQSWTYRNGVLYVYEYPDLVKYDYNPADTSFINRTIIIPGGGASINYDFPYTAIQSGDSLFIYNVSSGQIINTLDISSINHPHGVLIDSPYVYLHQTTYVTSVKEEANKLLKYQLQVYPNPFNPAANVVFTLPERGQASIRMYDILGREVKLLYNGEAEAGDHRLIINGADLSSGVYFIRLTADKYSDTKKVLLLK